MTLTKSEIFAEWLYRYTECLGTNCGDAVPTDAQKSECRKYADDSIKAIKNNGQSSLAIE
jgi:hypothetical protein